VILPLRNERDLDDIAPEVRQELEFVFVDTVDEVLANALRDGAITQPAAHEGQRPAGERTVLN
jgi:ATP-dependent Lon protease